MAAKAAERLAQAYPGLNVVGTHHGMLANDPELTAEALRQIKSARPDVLFVAMGIPMQEKFIAEHSADLGVPVKLGSGRLVRCLRRQIHTSATIRAAHRHGMALPGVD